MHTTLTLDIPWIATPAEEIFIRQLDLHGLTLGEPQTTHLGNEILFSRRVDGTESLSYDRLYRLAAICSVVVANALTRKSFPDATEFSQHDWDAYRGFNDPKNDLFNEKIYLSWNEEIIKFNSGKYEPVNITLCELDSNCIDSYGRKVCSRWPQSPPIKLDGMKFTGTLEDLTTVLQQYGGPNDPLAMISSLLHHYIGIAKENFLISQEE